MTYMHQIEKHEGTCMWITYKFTFEGLPCVLATYDNALFLKVKTTSKSSFTLFSYDIQNANDEDFKRVSKDKLIHAINKSFNVFRGLKMESFGEMGDEFKVFELVISFFLKEIGFKPPSLYIPFHNAEQYKRAENQVRRKIKELGFSSWITLRGSS